MIQFRVKISRAAQWAMALGLAGTLFVFGCGGNEEDGEDGAGGTGAGDGSGGKGSGGQPGAGGKASAGGSAGAESSGGQGGARIGKDENWIVGGWLLTEEGYFGYLTILDNLSASGEVDLAKVHQFPGDISYVSAESGVVLVGQEDRTTIERWVLHEEGGGLVKEGSIDLEYYGVTSTLAGAIQVLDKENAWYFDASTYQAIIFNPTTMTTEGDTVDFSGIVEQDYEMVLGNTSRLGDALVISAQYWDLEGNAVSLTRAAIIETDSHDVTYADDTRCGSTRFHAKDSAGNVYIGAHPGESLWQAGGFGKADAPKPCLLRIKSGETEFDAEYHVDLEDASGGKVVGGFMQGEDNHAYVYEYTGDIEDLTAENMSPSLRGDNWALARIKLGREKDSYTRVDNYEPSTAYGASFSVNVGGESVFFVISANASFESGRYYNMSKPTDAEEALGFPGFPGPAFNF